MKKTLICFVLFLSRFAGACDIFTADNAATKAVKTLAMDVGGKSFSMAGTFPADNPGQDKFPFSFTTKDGNYFIGSITLDRESCEVIGVVYNGAKTYIVE